MQSNWKMALCLIGMPGARSKFKSLGNQHERCGSVGKRIVKSNRRQSSWWHKRQRARNPHKSDRFSSSMHLGEFPPFNEDTNGCESYLERGGNAEVWLQTPYECNRSITLTMAFLSMASLSAAATGSATEEVRIHGSQIKSHCTWSVGERLAMGCNRSLG